MEHDHLCVSTAAGSNECSSISGLVVEYIVAIDVTQVRFPADATVGVSKKDAHI